MWTQLVFFLPKKFKSGWVVHFGVDNQLIVGQSHFKLKYCNKTSTSQLSTTCSYMYYQSSQMHIYCWFGFVCLQLTSSICILNWIFTHIHVYNSYGNLLDRKLDKFYRKISTNNQQQPQQEQQQQPHFNAYFRILMWHENKQNIVVIILQIV